MTSEQFVYWLQGYSEVSGEQPTKEQWQVIQDHLKTVFHKVTPTYTGIPGVGITPGTNYPQPWNNPGTTIC